GYGEKSNMTMEANICVGLVYLMQGDYRRAMDACGRAMAARGGEQLYERFGRAALPAVTSRTFLSLCLTQLGAFAEGIAVGEEGLRIAEVAKHPVSLVSAYRVIGRLYLHQGSLHRALPLLEPPVGICQAAALPF